MLAGPTQAPQAPPIRGPGDSNCVAVSQNGTCRVQGDT